MASALHSTTIAENFLLCTILILQSVIGVLLHGRKQDALTTGTNIERVKCNVLKNRTSEKRNLDVKFSVIN